jgi:hypothetical protein
VLSAALLTVFAQTPPKLVTPEQAGDRYTIVTKVKIAEPFDVRAMNDEFQSARLLSESGGVGTFEITYRPYHVQKITADPDWRRHDARMTDYLRPLPAANWNAELRKQIISDLREAGIDPDHLDDRTLVQQVSSWALSRTSYNNQFGLWMVRFDGAKASIPANLRPAFAREEPAGMSDQEVFSRELYGAGMYRTKTHGACTSTSTYLATVLRALGIPTRIVLTVPAWDPNDPNQLKTLLSAIRVHRAQYIIKNSLADAHGFVNHVFNEVWVGGKWVRLNYNRLGQPILDLNYEGLMTHVYTANDISEVPFAATWGARYATGAGPKLSSENPYQLLSARDALAPGYTLINPPVRVLDTVTVTAILKPDDPAIPAWLHVSGGTDAVLAFKEWIKDQNYIQMREFLTGAGRAFTLKADGHPDVRAEVTSLKISDGSGGFQAYGIHFLDHPAPGAAYRLIPDNAAHPHKWIIPANLVWRP